MSIRIAQIATETVQMTASFTDVTHRRSVFMPPVGVGPVLGLLSNPWGLVNLLRFNRAIKAAESIVAERRTEVTCGAYLASLSLPQGFIDTFLSPFMSAVWGCPWDRTAESSVYPLMKYIVLHRPAALSYYDWQVIAGGANAYIRKMATLLERATVHVHAPVTAIVKTAEGFEVRSEATGALPFDQVIVATGARDAARLIAETDGVASAQRALSGFEYYQAQVATHSDPSWMPPNRKHWAVGNARYDGESADMTIWWGRNTGESVFASYVQDTLPEETHHVSTFWLPLETPQHFEAQGALEAVQGQAGLWFAGDYTRDIGSHEDAVVSAVAIAEKLAPDAPRLAELG